VLGLNFYPQWSTQQLSVDRNGRLRYRATEQDGAGFEHLIRDYQARYDAPVMITETSARGSVEVREQWLDTSMAAIRRLRADGVPVLGYTWFPMFTMIDWKYRMGRRPLEDYYLDLGLYTLPRWKATHLVERFQAYMADPMEAVGDLAPALELASA
jgi:beta-glucosidase